MYEELYPVTYYFYPLLEDAPESSAQRVALDDVLRRPRAAAVESLLYVHIPYCHDLCRFCPFHVRVANAEETYRRYARALCAEIEALAKLPYLTGAGFKAVYFGGGSPSILPLDSIDLIFSTIERCLDVSPDAEISFEGEPRTLSDPALLELLRRHRVTRISFGVQTFVQVQRERFNIVATLEDVRRCTENAKSHGFSDVNADMMYDLPGQDLEALDYDLKMIGELGFDSVDYYNLHYFAFPSSFKKAVERAEIPPKPDQAMHFALAGRIDARMGDLGYVNVADQIFSRNGRLCEYFRLLWGGGAGDHAAETIGVGSSARSYVQGISYMNSGDVAAYQEAVDGGRMPVVKVSSRLDAPENRGAVFMPKFRGLGKDRGAAWRSIPEAVRSEWLAAHLVRETGEAWELTENGKLWTTNMMVDAFEAKQRRLGMSSLVTLEKKPGVRTGSF